MRDEQRRKVTTITRSTVHSGAHYGASRENRSAFGYWIPLALTVTAATVGLVAWVWSERGDDESESEPEHYYANAPQPNSQRPGSSYGARDDMRTSGPAPGGFGGDAAAAAAAAGIGAAAGYAGMSGGPPPGPGPLGPGPPQQGSFAPGPPTQGGFQGPPPGPPMSRPPGGEASSYFRETNTRDISSGPPPQEDQTFFGRMSNALGMTNYTRGGTPGRTNFTGGGWASDALAAAGSMVGGAVSSVVGTNENYEEQQEVKNVSMSGSGEQRNHFSDQEKWSEEADKPERKDSMSPRKSQQSFRDAAAVGLGAAALGSVAARESRSGSVARNSYVDARGSAVDQTSKRGSVMDAGSTRESFVGNQGAAAEFYSGAVEVPRRASVTTTHRKTVALVVSSLEKGDGSTEVDMHQSILARIPESLHADRTRVIVMIYAPDLNVHPLSAISRRASERRSQSAPSVRSRSTSSYQNINTPGANGTPLPTPGDFPQDPENTDQGILANVSPRPLDSQSNLSRQGSRVSASGDRRQSDMVEYIGDDDVAVANPVDEETSTLFKTLYNQANAIVDRDTSIIPFTRLESCKHLLRSIQPELVYIQESLCGTDGSIVSELQGWVRNVVVVIGDEGGYGGLVDSDEEDNVEKYRADNVEGEGKWWKRESVSGLGRGVSIVESLRVADDWRRRVNEEE